MYRSTAQEINSCNRDHTLHTVQTDDPACESVERSADRGVIVAEARHVSKEGRRSPTPRQNGGMRERESGGGGGGEERRGEETGGGGGSDLGKGQRHLPTPSDCHPGRQAAAAAAARTSRWKGLTVRRQLPRQPLRLPWRLLYV